MVDGDAAMKMDSNSEGDWIGPVFSLLVTVDEDETTRGIWLAATRRSIACGSAGN
jgi:hypothetical protein